MGDHWGDNELEGEPVEFENIRCEYETSKAIFVNIEGIKCWIPKSQIHDNSEVYKAGTEGTLVITEWIAVKKGLV